MLSETSMSAWIPALHTGMTQSGSCTKTHQGATSRIFKEHAMNRGEKIHYAHGSSAFFV
jgi:hypothetical protein